MKRIFAKSSDLCFQAKRFVCCLVGYLRPAASSGTGPPAGSTIPIRISKVIAKNIALIRAGSTHPNDLKEFLLGLVDDLHKPEARRTKATMVRRTLPLVLLLLTLLDLITALPSLGDQINNRIIDSTELIDSSDDEGLSLFRDALRAVGMLEAVLGDASQEMTVFAPNNAAIRASSLFQLYMTGLDEQPYPRWHHNLRAALSQHIVPNQKLSYNDIFNLQVSELPSMRDSILVNQILFTIQNGKIVEQDVVATNGVLHVVDTLIKAQFYDQPFSMLELQPELGPDELNRTALTDVTDFVGGRAVLNAIRESGTTFVGCRIRAFNRLEEYLPQTINGSPKGVILGEFLNETFRAETIENFLQYSQIAKNYYRADMEDNYEELVTPVPGCGHMWITKKDGRLCFNNGCVISTPDPREFLASNGYVY